MSKARHDAYKQGVRIAVTVAPSVSEMIDRLLATGLFGHNRAGVVQGLIYRSLRDESVRVFTGPASGWGPRKARRKEPTR